MAEYIEREAALALIRPDDPNDERCAVTVATAKRLIRYVLTAAPAADVVPVVRCEKCKYVRAKVNIHTGEQVGVWCYLWDEIDIGADDYCSRGKPREEVT